MEDQWEAEMKSLRCYRYKARVLFDAIHNDYAIYCEVVVPERDGIRIRLEGHKNVVVIKPTDLDPSKLTANVVPYSILASTRNGTTTHQYCKVSDEQEIFIPTEFIDAAIEHYEAKKRLNNALTDDIRERFGCPVPTHKSKK